ncbi:hypothetical protein DL93DRAFT_299701 [Clavulina sp. PMI_390]|nr:hypothetical protein DL93DRAFT_299701 [Clavulina sp. PMI_390]
MQNLQKLFVQDVARYDPRDRANTMVLPSLHSCAIGHSHWGTVSLDSFLKNNPTIRSVYTRVHLSKVARFFLATGSGSGSEAVLPNLERLYYKGTTEYLGELKHWFEYIRARQQPFVICLESTGKDVDKELIEQYADVLRMEIYTPL